IPLPHRVKSPPEQYAVSVRFGIAEGPAVFRVLLRSAPPVGVSWRMAYTMETSRTTIACLLVEYSSRKHHRKQGQHGCREMVIISPRLRSRGITGSFVPSERRE